MTNTEGLRWVWRITAAAVVLAFVFLLPTPGALGTAREDRHHAYPRCTADGGVNGWVWFAGGQAVGVTKDPIIVVDGTTHTARKVDCAPAAECLAAHPELSGKLATVIGTPNDDRLFGTSGRDLMVGRAGNDDIQGRSGGDILCGGPGDDVIRGGRGDDVLFGGGGKDQGFGGAGRDTADGGPGRDALYGQAGSDHIDGGSGDDSCFGGGSIDELFGCSVAIQTAAVFGGSRTRDFAIVVDDGLKIRRVDVVTEVDRILADERSWIADGVTGFRRTADNADFTIIVASPDTVDDLCAPLGTGGYLSCRNGSRVILNVNRWTEATEWWADGIDTYREYLVNHEVGHLLGHGHVGCPGEGEAAPVMMQQTKGLGACLANGWPFADVAAG